MALLNRKPKRRTDRPRPVPTLFKGLAVVLVLLGLGLLMTRLYSGVPGRQYGKLYLSVPEVGNLLPHDSVRIHGVRVGQVLTRDVGKDGQPRIELQLNPGTKLPKGTQVTVRANGLLGARYVELMPGKDRQMLADGATVKGGIDSYTYGLPETLTTFDDETQGRTGDLIRGLGEGLYGQGMGLNDTIHIAGTKARPFTETVQAILRRDGAAARLVPALDAAVAPLDRNRRELAQMSGVAADAVTPFVTERDAVRTSLGEAPSAVHAVTPGLTRGTRLLGAVQDVANEARRTLPDAPAGLRGLSGLLSQTRPLRRALPLVRSIKPAAPGLIRISRSLNPVLAPLERTLENADKPLDTISRHECDLRNFGVVMRSMTGYVQPGTGASGPSGAFRLQLVSPLSTDLVGVKDAAKVNTRRGVVAPCTFLSKPYSQFVGGGAG